MWPIESPSPELQSPAQLSAQSGSTLRKLSGWHILPGLFWDFTGTLAALFPSVRTPWLPSANLRPALRWKVRGPHSGPAQAPLQCSVSVMQGRLRPSAKSRWSAQIWSLKLDLIKVFNLLQFTSEKAFIRNIHQKEIKKKRKFERRQGRVKVISKRGKEGPLDFNARKRLKNPADRLSQKLVSWFAQRNFSLNFSFNLAQLA